MGTPIYRNQSQVEFCELLERAEKKGFSAADVSRALKLSKASISKIKSGKQTPRAGTIQHLRSLVEGLGTDTYADMELREEAVRYAAKIINLPDGKRELAKNLIDQLAGDAGGVSSDAGNSAGKILHKISSAVDDQTAREAAKPPVPGVQPPSNISRESTSPRASKSRKPKHSS